MSRVKNGNQIKERGSQNYASGLTLGISTPLWALFIKRMIAHSEQESNYYAFFVILAALCGLILTIYLTIGSVLQKKSFQHKHKKRSTPKQESLQHQKRKSLLITLILICVIAIAIIQSNILLYANHESNALRDTVEIAIILSAFLITFITILSAFPGSFTLGECFIVSSSATLYLFDFATRLIRQFLPSSVITPNVIIAKVVATQVEMCMEFLILGMLGTMLALLPITYNISPLNTPSKSSKNRIRALLFYIGVIVCIGGVLSTGLQTFLDDVNPFIWVANQTIFCTEHPHRLGIMIAWIIILVTFIMTLAWTASHLEWLSNIIIRKFFHLLTVAMFVPAAFVDLSFLKLSFAVALAGLMLVEVLRMKRIPPAGKAIHRFMHTFVDTRDAGRVTLTHFYLLLGCAVNAWLSEDSFLATTGVIIIGLGDSAAAAFGKRYGKVQWAGTAKTVEGTLAALTVVVITCSALLALTITSPSVTFLQTSSFLQQTVTIVWASFIACILEAYTTEIDNIILPITFLAQLHTSSFLLS